MSVNPNNYLGATVTIVGYLAADPAYPAYDKQGTRGWRELSIPINEGYKKDGEFVQTGTTWYRVSVSDEMVDQYFDNGTPLKKGAKVRVDNAKQEVREYKAKDGTEKLGITLSYGEITVLESGNSEETPF